MSSIHADSYDHYGTPAQAFSSMLQGAYSNGFPFTIPNPPLVVPSFGVPHGSYALWNNQQGAYNKVIAGGARNQLLVSIRFATDALPVGPYDGGLIDFRDFNGKSIAFLQIGPAGQLQLRQGSNPEGTAVGNVIAQTSGPVVLTHNWHVAEMLLDYTGNAFTLRIDDADATGSPAIAATGLTWGNTVTTGPAILGLLYFPISHFGSTNYIKDLWIRDTAGTDAFTNTFVGDFNVGTLLDDADTAVAGMTPHYRQKLSTGILDNTATNACVTAASSTSTDLGSGDFTIEGFVRFNALPTTTNKSQIIGKWDETNNKRSYQLYMAGPGINNGALVFRTSTDGLAGTVVNKVAWPWQADTDTWHYLALVRTSGELLLFIDGGQVGLPIADAQTYFASTEGLGVGAQFEGTTSVVAGTQFNGWLDELRLTVGYARYTASFTPPVVPLPRGSIADAHWANVALLCGFDNGIVDESGFASTLTARNSAAAITPADGPSVGAYSTVRKPTLIDDTFIQASFLPAVGTLSLAALPANNDTVTVGTKSGPAAAVYKFKTALATAYDVLIDVDVASTLSNLLNAINAGPGVGTKYGTGTLANLDVTATALPAGQMLVTANAAGTAGNAIASTVSLTNGGGWGGATLSGGVNIPGPSEFLMDRPPPLTTLIYAAHLITRAMKTDAGPGSFKTSLVGPLGAALDGSTHALTTSLVYYEDPIEHDPDTGGNITPSTIVGGRRRHTRTA